MNITKYKWLIHTQLLIHIVFAVKGRQNLIKEDFRVLLQKYISGIISAKQCNLLAIYCNPDHTHILIGINPSTTISDLVRDIKANSSKFINQSGWVTGKFEWQAGFGAFSYCRSHLDVVVKYILNQQEHHRRKSFREEYLELLEKYQIEFDRKYVFEFID